MSTEIAPDPRTVASGDQYAQLRNVPLFAALDDEAAGRLARLLQMRDYPADITVFRTGDPGDALYLIERGSVCISVTDTEGHDVTLAELSDGEFFGEMAMLDGKGRSADARTVSPARLAVLTRQDFLDFVSSDSRLVLAMLAAMTHRLRHTHDILRHRVSRNVNTEHAAHTTMADRAADVLATFGVAGVLSASPFLLSRSGSWPTLFCCEGRGLIPSLTSCSISSWA